MTVEQARRKEIAAKIRNGRPQAEIAAEYGVSVRTIGRISKQMQADAEAQAQAEALAAANPPTEQEELMHMLMASAKLAHQAADAALRAVDPDDPATVRAAAPLLASAVRASEAAIKLIPPDTGINIIVRIGDIPQDATEGDGWRVVSITPDYDPNADDAPPDATLPASSSAALPAPE